MSFENGPSISNQEVSDTSSFDKNQEPEIQDDYDSDIQEQLPERFNRLSISLGNLSLEGTVELQEEQEEQEEQPEKEAETPQDDEIDYGEYEAVDEDEGEDENEKDKDELLREQEEELEYLKKKEHQQKKQSKGEDLTNDSTRDAALEFVYLATGMPVDEMK